MSQKPRQPTRNDLSTLESLRQNSRLSDLSSALGLTDSTTKSRLEQLRAKGFAETIKGGRDWQITPEGKAALEQAPTNPENPPEPSPKDSDTPPQASNWTQLDHLAGWADLCNLLPLPEYRAALRLVLAVALLRQRAPNLSPMPWIGIYGTTGTGKSTVAMCARAIFGGYFFQVGTMTAGQAIGRRSSKPPYTIEQPPQTLTGAVTDLDELAEAPEAVRTAVYALMQRLDGFVTIEGEDLPNRAAIVATWNPSAQPVPLPVGALRRGLLMDTTRFKQRLEKGFGLSMIGTDIRAILDTHPAPWVDIQTIPAPQPIQDKAALEQARRVLFGVLKTPSDHPLPALTGIGAAYAVLFGLTEAAALEQAVQDMAALAATRAETRPDWREQIRQAYSRTPDTTEPEAQETDPAAQVRQELERTKQRAHLVQRAANAREPLRKHWAALEPQERELAAPLLAQLEAIGQGAPNANPDRLNALESELSNLEHQAVSLARAVQARLENAQYAAQAQKQAEQRRLEQQKADKVATQQRIKGYRQTAKALRDAVRYKDSALDTDRAKRRQEVIGWCYKHYLEYRHPPQLPSDTGQGWLANLGRSLENNRRAFVQHTHERSTGRQIADLDAWMLQKAAQLENEANALERGDTRALAPAQNARALPVGAPAQGVKRVL